MRGAADRRIELAAERADDVVVVQVVDHGPGLAFGDQQLLFTPFYKLQEGSPRLSAGLGLAICKGFVTAMGGEIWATDTPGGGTTIGVPAPGRRMSGQVVLVVDDEPQILRAVERTLTRARLRRRDGDRRAFGRRRRGR